MLLSGIVSVPGLVFVGMGAGFMSGEIAAAGLGGTVRFAGIVLAFATLDAIQRRAARSGVSKARMNGEQSMQQTLIAKYSLAAR